MDVIDYCNNTLKLIALMLIFVGMVLLVLGLDAWSGCNAILVSWYSATVVVVFC
jgi:hypothetical protein